MRPRIQLFASLLVCLCATSLAAQSNGWRPAASVGFVGGGAGGWEDDYNYSTGKAFAIEVSASHRLAPGLSFNAGATTFYSYDWLGLECTLTCEQDVHLLGVFGTVRQKIPATASGWGLVGELGAGGIQLRNARRDPGVEMIAADGPAFTGGLELRTGAVWKLVPSVHYREYIILRPDMSTLRFQSLTLKIGTR